LISSTPALSNGALESFNKKRGKNCRYQTFSQFNHSQKGKQRFNGIPIKASSEWVERIQSIYSISQKAHREGKKRFKGIPIQNGLKGT
jgi:hypothetical protein